MRIIILEITSLFKRMLLFYLLNEVVYLLEHFKQQCPLYKCSDVCSVSLFYNMYCLFCTAYEKMLACVLFEDCNSSRWLLQLARSEETFLGFIFIFKLVTLRGICKYVVVWELLRMHRVRILIGYNNAETWMANAEQGFATYDFVLILDYSYEHRVSFCLRTLSLTKSLILSLWLLMKYYRDIICFKQVQKQASWNIIQSSFC